MNDLVVTTTLKTTPHIVKAAEELSLRLKVPYVPRDKKSLELIKKAYLSERILIAGRDKLTLITGSEEYFFHPSMAKVRIKDIICGKPDQMINAMQLVPGYTVLDCTLGLGTDALVSSFVVGNQGKVVGLEKVTLIELITAHGLKNYLDNNKQINEAMSRIEVIQADYSEYLSSLPDKSFDVVYFDPMFRRPRMKSSAINSLRSLADTSPINREYISEAVRVAKKRVVVKETRNSEEFARLGMANFIGGKYSPIAYGVIEL